MFTGIIEGIGKIKRKAWASHGDITICIEPPFSTKQCTLGESICIDGVCLTVVKIGEEEIYMDVSQETLNRSTLKMLDSGDLVNIERALRLSDRLGGHIVLGHVDGIGKIVYKEQRRGSWILGIKVDRELARYIVEKGSIAVDGISLTVNKIQDEVFEVNIIPETAKRTTLLKKRIEFVNIETDIIGKYVEKFVNNIKLKGSINIEMLKKYGFA